MPANSFALQRHDISRSIDPVKFNQSMPTLNPELDQMLRLSSQVKARCRIQKVRATHVF
jgi:hypothetical protein